ncbi:MAG: Na+/H+ antiporter subunit E [bacterium]
MLLLFFILWIILNGRVTAEILIFGCLISALLFLFLWKMFGWNFRRERTFLGNFPVFLAYVFCLIWEIVKAALAVAGLALSPRRRPDPVLVEFDSDLKGSFRNVLLANAITLTPGTITVSQKDGHFIIHCLRPEYGEGLDKCSFARILKKMKSF